MGIDDNGFLYSILIDPFLSKFHISALDFIGNNHRVLDVACGTGSFVFIISKKAEHVTGIDLSSSMIDFAQKKKNKMSIDNVSFYVRDAADLTGYRENEFDTAAVSMAMHQFPVKTGITLLKELKRIAENIIIIDYTSPPAENIYRRMIDLVERIAGGEHYRNFKEYHSHGGIDYLLKECGLKCLQKKIDGNGQFSIVKCGL